MGSREWRPWEGEEMRKAAKTVDSRPWGFPFFGRELQRERTASETLSPQPDSMFAFSLPSETQTLQNAENLHCSFAALRQNQFSLLQALVLCNKGDFYKTTPVFLKDLKKAPYFIVLFKRSSFLFYFLPTSWGQQISSWGQQIFFLLFG